MNNAISSNTLKRVIFTGCTKYFDQFSIFSATFGSTIEHLMINIQVNYITVDGKRLELDFLNNMPRLSSLDLIIHSKMTRNKPINMETFQNSLWDKFKPIVYWYDPQVGQHTIFTLPYKFDQVNERVKPALKMLCVCFVVPTTFQQFSFNLYIKSRSFSLF